MGLVVLLGMLGFGMLLWGFVIRVGTIKNWWLSRFNPIVPEAGAYIGIPLGIILLAWSLALLQDDMEIRGKVLDYTGILFIITVVLVMWRPRWLLPGWLRWLEDHHEDILPLLKKEAQMMGGHEWGRRVRTQEGLEEWVAEVRQKYGK